MTNTVHQAFLVKRVKGDFCSIGLTYCESQITASSPQPLPLAHCPTSQSQLSAGLQPSPRLPLSPSSLPTASNFQASVLFLSPAAGTLPPPMFVCRAMSYLLSDMLDAQLKSYAPLLLQYVFTFKTKSNHYWVTMHKWKKGDNLKSGVPMELMETLGRGYS